MPKLLVIDDEPLICQSFEWVFTAGDVEVATAGTVAEGWQQFAEGHPDAIVLDYQLPDGTGLDLFDRIREARPACPVIFLTAYGTTGTAIEAMKRGAFDYLGKPFDLDEMTRLLERAFEASRAEQVPPPEAEEPSREQIIGRSPLIREVCKQIGRVAPVDVAVLILGESGTGKELVARAIHDHSKRAGKPFLAINCAAIPEGLVESELFGHEPGAFTGAGQGRIGRFEQADGGTLLLDEIGDMPLPVQAKVLRFLQDQTFERVGGRKAVSTRVRILAATNHDLDRLIAAGRFRADLYYRLKEVTIRIAPLRDRAEDIPDLASHFLLLFARETGRDLASFAPAALDAMRRYPWPGNVRELRGIVKEAALRTTGRVVLPQFLPAEIVNATPAPAPAPAVPDRSAEIDLAGAIESMLRADEKEIHERIIRMVERELFTRVLRQTRGHQGMACERLGIDRKTLRNKLRDLRITFDKVATHDPDGTD